MGASQGKKKIGGGDAEGRIFNLVMLGIGGVGKSALTIQFVQDKFIKDYDPTIEDSYRKQVVVDGKVVMITIWDTAGQEEYEALQDGYIRDADGFCIVYSIIDRKSFDAVQKFHRKILMTRDSNQEPIIVLGNKSDLEESREVTTAEGKAKAHSLGCEFQETSAKLRTNVESSFHTLIRNIRISKKKNG
jgi:small GTP-binding protein